MAKLVEADNGTEFKSPEFDVIRGILDGIKRQHYVEGYKASDAEALGILMSKWFRWDGRAILVATYAGLEDANFHTENKTIGKLIADLDGG